MLCVFLNVSTVRAAVHRPIHALHHHGWEGEHYRQSRRQQRAHPIRLRRHPLDFGDQSPRSCTTLGCHLLPLQEGKQSGAFTWHAAGLNTTDSLTPCAPLQVSYLPFSEAFQRAEAENKLVHSILLWGALDDQSCWGELVHATGLHTGIQSLNLFILKPIRGSSRQGDGAHAVRIIPSLSAFAPCWAVQSWEWVVFWCVFPTSLSVVCHIPIGSGRTLRETVLESSPVLALLNQSFISSWSLVKELENMQVSGAMSQEMK